jgi:enoyl-CoA hydratase/carnithine racemase
MTEDTTRLLVDIEDGIQTLTLNRPERMNALDLRTLQELDRAVGQAAANPKVRAVVLTGTGRAFSAGADVKEWAAGEYPDPDVEPTDDWVTLAHRIVARIYRLPKPVIAAVNGVAVGAGLDIALAADFRIASETARFGSVYIRLGIPPDAGASFLLPRIVGLVKAKELIYTGRIINADEASSIGLVTEVVPADDLTAAANRWASLLANGPTLAIGMAKENIQEHLTISSIESALKNEMRAAAVCTATADHKEGLAAVNDKREPQFVGK